MVVTGVVQTFWKRGGSRIPTLTAVSRHRFLAYVELDLLKLAFERSGLLHLLYLSLQSTVSSCLFLFLDFLWTLDCGARSCISQFTVLSLRRAGYIRWRLQEGRTGRKKLKMAEEMAAPTSGAPPAATDHEFTSHQEGPVPVPLNNASRRSTLSKSYLDVHVAGTTTPHSVNRHSHMGDLALENYFVCFSNLQFQCRKLAESSANEKARSDPEI
jgi:hypothetical protein